MSRSVILSTPLARRTAHAYVDEAPEGWVVTYDEPLRTPAQNKQQWPYLEGFSQQKKWSVNGEMVNMTPEEFKDVFTAAFYKETVRLAAGVDGGVVMLGKRTSKMKKAEFREWMAFLKATAADRGVTPVYANTPRETPEGAEA